MSAEIVFTELPHAEFCACIVGMEPTQCQGVILLVSSELTSTPLKHEVTLRCKECKKDFTVVATFKVVGPNGPNAF